MPHTESRETQPRKWTPRGIRFATTLTEPLLLELCQKHYEGRDFRTRTAARCGVDPDRLQHWLEEGARDIHGDSLQSRLYREFAIIEGDIAAEWIDEVCNTETAAEESFYDDEGNLTSKTVTRRSTAGIQWLLTTRFRQFKPQHEPKPGDQGLGELLPKQGGGLTLEAAMALCTQLARSMPLPLLPVFSREGWLQLSDLPPDLAAQVRAAIGAPKELTHGTISEASAED